MTVRGCVLFHGLLVVALDAPNRVVAFDRESGDFQLLYESPEPFVDAPSIEDDSVVVRTRSARIGFRPGL